MGGYAPGLFSWTDISLPDLAAGSRFYVELFGWEAEEQHDPDGNHIYTMLRRGGKDVAGMGPLPPDMQATGIPPMWNSYSTVASVDNAVETALANGGTVVLPAMDVMTSGRMAIVADPTGGVVSLWEPGDHKGSGVFNVHGALTWNELATRDVEAAKSFYAAVLGWSFERSQGENEYWLILVDGKVDGDEDADDNYNGGIMPMDDTWPANLPSHWMVYFKVDDVDAIIPRLEELGGSVSVPPFDTPAGRISVVADPQGGTFSMIADPAAS